MLGSAWKSEYIAVDWGTTNRRAYRLAVDGDVTDSFEDELGVLAVEKDRFDLAVTEIRGNLGNLPMLLGGMIGSNKGWHEVPYIACPAGAEEIAANILWIDDRTGIVPGVSQSIEPDVMRGEEVQALGAVAAGLAPTEGLICLPGTHAKWIMMVEGRIDSFHTAMTGEIFSLLKEHSILTDLLQDEVADGPSFRAGVADSLQHRPLLSALFGIRARYLLDKRDAGYASYASGLLIGTDVVAALDRYSNAMITLVGRPDLCTLYAQAAAEAGKEAIAIDGGEAFIAGIAALLGHLQ